MAKCLRQVGQGVPIRLLDDDARKFVEVDHDGEYCSKSFFKNWYKDRPEEERVRANLAAAGRHP